ncbi:CYFA0S23e00309g1_1 [Cyberlindnera fabianii]|uniref:CYFA0S23e00309g1_1 n=2 Tax=Cyberlindnera fabianii TaxID=36022 RepID=A0A061B8X5_CYBFA|nr:CYFA0S23e00309g1_1 [Cyberlindnera fabianii]
MTPRDMAPRDRLVIFSNATNKFLQGLEELVREFPDMVYNKDSIHSVHPFDAYYKVLTRMHKKFIGDTWATMLVSPRPVQITDNIRSRNEIYPLFLNLFAQDQADDIALLIYERIHVMMREFLHRRLNLRYFFATYNVIPSSEVYVYLDQLRTIKTTLVRHPFYQDYISVFHDIKPSADTFAAANQYLTLVAFARGEMELKWTTYGGMTPLHIVESTIALKFMEADIDFYPTMKPLFETMVNYLLTHYNKFDFNLAAQYCDEFHPGEEFKFVANADALDKREKMLQKINDKTEPLWSILPGLMPDAV